MDATINLWQIIAEHGMWLASGARPNSKQMRADLSGADLSRADLSGADLSGAYLSGAYLSGANLMGTCLQPLPTPWAWQQDHGCGTRIVDGRVLALARRTPTSIVAGDTVYEPGRLYFAPWFSRDTTTECHPGLYLADTNETKLPEREWRYVAYWLDELVVAGTMQRHKARVPRFRALFGPAAFAAVTAADMDCQEVNS